MKRINLKKKLRILEKKYQALTSLIEKELSMNGNHEENVEITRLFDERKLIQRRIQRLLQQIDYISKSKTSKNGDIIGVGSTVVLKNCNLKLKTKLVEEVFSQDNSEISINSPIGKAVLGKRVGESIKISTPRGKVPYKILQIL